jgi:hypothetical protein
MGNVEILLEVVPQGEVKKRCASRGQFHAGCQTALNKCQIASRQMPIEIRDEGMDLHTGRRIKRTRIDPRTRYENHPQFRYPGAGQWKAPQNAPDEMRTDA